MTADRLSLTVVGPGAIGLFYGTRLALAGAQVNLLLRSDLAAVRAAGVRMTTRGETVTVPPTRFGLFASAEEAGPADVVLITLKNTANAEFSRLLTPLVGRDTIILTLQNGLGADEQLAALFGAERILGGLAFIGCNRVAPGVIEAAHAGSIALGEFGRPVSERARCLASWFERAGVKCRAVDNVAEARWRKLVWNIPFNGLSIVAGGLTCDRLLSDPQLHGEVRALMDEVARGARALGFEVSEKFIQSQIDATPPLGAYRPSSLIDWEAGRAVEVEAIWGEPLRRARAAGVDLPRLALLYALLQARTNYSRGGAT